MASREQLSKQEWTERTAAKVALAQETLAAEVTALQSGEDWRRYLAFQARLHTYSPNNVMLIAAQHAFAYGEGRVGAPEPTYVAGFNTWRALGRSVDKGQHGYAVLAPCRYERQIAVDPDGNARRLVQDRRYLAGQVEHRTVNTDLNERVNEHKFRYARIREQREDARGTVRTLFLLLTRQQAGQCLLFFDR